MIEKKVSLVLGVIALVVVINSSNGFASASLDFLSGISGYPGDTVFLDINLTSNSDSVASLNFDINYNVGILRLIDIQVGTTADSAGKSLEHNSIYPGKERCLVFGINQNNIADGQIVQVEFFIKSDAPAGDVDLSLSNAVAADTEAQEVELILNNGIITINQPVICQIAVSPASATLQSGETVDFQATTTCNGNMVTGSHTWEIIQAGGIGSSIDANTGKYSAGDNNTGFDVTETIKVDDALNNETATAVVMVMRNVKLELSPKVLYSHSKKTRLYTLRIWGEKAAFNDTSFPDFQPNGYITLISWRGFRNVMIARVSVSPNVLDGPVDLSITTEINGNTATVKKEGAIMIKKRFPSYPK
ncbi:MAG: cohesin domain-containing protein [Thermodesulfobacteriota bacterium]|nr:cohesin domain-containing protein [Thermodesulfobacteriota bacterium]